MVNRLFETGGAGSDRGLALCREKGRFYVFLYEKPGSARLVRWKEARRAYIKLVEDWHMVGGVQHESWSGSSAGTEGRGRRGFIAANMKRQMKGEPLELFRPYRERSVLRIESGPGSRPGEMAISFAERLPRGKHLTLFTQRINGCIASGLFLRHDCGDDQKSCIMLDGLEPGTEYYIYAVASDRAYDEATSVSASAVCRGFAA